MNEISSPRRADTQDLAEGNQDFPEREHGPHEQFPEYVEYDEAEEYEPVQGPDDVVSDDESIPDEVLSETFEKISAELSGPDALKTLEQHDKFTTMYDRYFNAVLVDRNHRSGKHVGKTSLHVIAEARGPSHGWLVESILDNFPGLILQEDTNGKTPLHLAIEKKKEYFVEIVLEKNRDIDTLLILPDMYDENCLHAAIRLGLGVDTTKKIIQKAPQQTLSARNSTGHTPLHLAVEHNRCTEEQLEIVRLLIEYGDSAFDPDPSRKYIGTNSVYQHHIVTRPKVVKENPQTRNLQKERLPMKKTLPPVASISSSERAGVRKDEDKVKRLRQIEDERQIEEERQRKAAQSGGGDLKEARPGNGINDDRRDVSKRLPRQLTGNIDGSPSNLDKKGKIGPNEGIPRTPSTRAKATLKGPQTPPRTKRPSLAEIKQNSSASKSSKKRRQQSLYRGHLPTDASVSAIEKELKLSYLRTAFGTRTKAGGTRDHNSALAFLHGQNQKNVQIAFEFRGGDKEITEGLFKSSYASFTFDTILQYVAFGPVNLFPRRNYPSGPDVHAQGIESYSKRGKGKEDIAILFQWLYSKGVRSIVKVIVDDLESPSHTNEAIELALRDFEIEILDWRKVDLDPRTLCKAKASVLLRELHLRWSGNNAILRAWSEAEGLVTLTSLEKIHLHEKQDLENDTRMEADIREFKQRLARHPKDIEVILVKEDGHKSFPETNPSNNDAPSPHEAKVDPHRWLKCMDEFSNAIQKVESKDWESHILGDTFHQSILKAPVKIVLIDDGASKVRQTIGEKLMSGKSFDSGTNDKDLLGGPRPYHISASGHGTLMAEMMCRVCPMVEISVLKLDVYPTGPDGELIFTAESAAAAVDYAAKGDCDIISMSWTIDEVATETQDNTEAIRKLKDALDLAIIKGKLMFCSAPDQGDFDSNCYPLTYQSLRDGPGGIFRIGAAKPDGKAWGWAGHEKDLDFILPGYEVREKSEEGMVPGILKKHTGSSVATALAAGLAALLIHCVRLGALYAATMPGEKGKETTRLTEKHIRDAKKYHQMMELLKRAGSIKHEDGKYLQVWNTFENLANEVGRATVDDAEAEKLDREGKDGRTKKQLELIASLAYNLIVKQF